MSLILLFIINEPLIIVTGIALGSILIVSPVFLSDGNIEHSLQAHKKLYKITLLIFVLVNIIISVLAVTVYGLIVDFNNVESLYSTLFQIIIALFSQWFYVYLSRKLNVRVQQDAVKVQDAALYYDDYNNEDYELHKYNSDLLFNNKLDYFKNRLISDVHFSDDEITYIYKYADEYEIEFSYIHSILTIEKFNRGDFITKYKEEFSVNFLPQFTLIKDPSLGVGQIKVSTAKKYFPQKTELELQKLLLNKEFNISLCANIIKDIQNNIDLSNPNLGLVKIYTTGDINANLNNTIRLYYLLFEWLLNTND